MSSQLDQKIDEILKKHKLDGRLKKADKDDSAFDTFHIFVGLDPEGRESAIQLVAKTFGVPREMIKGAPQRVSLEFNMEFPFQFTSYTLFDITRLISFLNVSAEFPGFYVSEMDDVIGFRYIWVGDEMGVNHYLLLGIIGSVTVLRDLYLEVIEDVATGKRSLESVLEMIAEATKELLKK